MGNKKNGHQSGVGILDGQDIDTFQGTLFPKQKTEKLLIAKFGPQDGTSNAAGSQRKTSETSETSLNHIYIRK